MYHFACGMEVNLWGPKGETGVGKIMDNLKDVHVLIPETC